MKRGVQLQVEQLNARVLPNATGLSASLAMSEVAVSAFRAAVGHHLVGHGNGTFTRASTNPDIGSTFSLTGAGRFAGLKIVTIEGTLHSVGFIAHGHATGTLTLTNAHGSVTLALTGPLQTGFAPLPSVYHYHLISGTGDYSNWQDHGTLTLHATGGVFHIALA